MSNCYVYVTYVFTIIMKKYSVLKSRCVQPCYLICDPINLASFVCVTLLNHCCRNTKMSITMSKGSILQAFQVLIILKKRGGWVAK